MSTRVTSELARSISWTVVVIGGGRCWRNVLWRVEAFGLRAGRFLLLEAIDVILVGALFTWLERSLSGIFVLLHVLKLILLRSSETQSLTVELEVESRETNSKCLKW